MFCTNLIPSKDKAIYCEEHSHLEEKRKKKQFSYFKKIKKEKGDTFYQRTAWRRLRAAKIIENPVCEVCKIELAREVHHVKPRKEFPELSLDWDNLQSICSACHKSLTAMEMAERRKDASKISV